MAVSQITLGYPSGTKLFTDTDSAEVAVTVQAASTTVYSVEIDNTANAAQDNYVKLFNTAGTPDVGTDAPDAILEVRQGVSRVFVIPSGWLFETGLAVATVTAGGTAGVTPPTAAVIVRIVYA